MDMLRQALIVDDDAEISRVFCRALALWGWRAEECPSITAALATFQKGSFDLALCDVDLLDGDGIVLAKALLKVKPSLIVVIVSGNPANLDRARASGMTARLQKPFDLAELKALLEHENSAKIT